MDKAQQRERMAEQVEQYLADGGEIETLAPEELPVKASRASQPDPEAVMVPVAQDRPQLRVLQGATIEEDRPISLEKVAMFNPKNVRFDVGTGGTPALVPEDVAGHLVGLYRPAYLLVLRKNAGDKTVTTPLLQYLTAAVGMEGQKAGWISDRDAVELDRVLMYWIYSGREPHAMGVPGRVLGLARGLLDDFLCEYRCPKCEGRGYLKTGPKCKRCDASGRLQPSQAFLAQGCGIDRRRWSEVWQERFEQLRRIPLSWYDLAERHNGRRHRRVTVRHI